jgi:hypothetical protein
MIGKLSKKALRAQAKPSAEKPEKEA